MMFLFQPHRLRCMASVIPRGMAFRQ